MLGRGQLPFYEAGWLINKGLWRRYFVEIGSSVWNSGIFGFYFGKKRTSVALTRGSNGRNRLPLKPGERITVI
ncbi:hypothetical protein J25TS5_37580 [Paenibacillus faecis]|nr:hypothetical protein J25TS5_37580 [Paenibacillus faecis]